MVVLNTQTKIHTTQCGQSLACIDWMLEHGLRKEWQFRSKTMDQRVCCKSNFR